jgi:hypothetical protein
MLRFKGVRFPIDVILVRIGRLSYWRLEAMMGERGASVGGSMINRRVIRFLRLIEKLSRKHKRKVGRNSEWTRLARQANMNQGCDPLGLDSSQPFTSLQNQPEDLVESLTCAGKRPFLIKR